MEGIDRWLQSPRHPPLPQMAPGGWSPTARPVRASHRVAWIVLDQAPNRWQQTVVERRASLKMQARRPTYRTGRTGPDLFKAAMNGLPKVAVAFMLYRAALAFRK